MTDYVGVAAMVKCVQRLVGNRLTRRILDIKTSHEIIFVCPIEECPRLMSISSLEKVDRHNIKFRDLIALFKDIRIKSFSGHAIIQVESEPSRMFSFNLGCLAWISGGMDPLNRWQRNLDLANFNLSLATELDNCSTKTVIGSYVLAQKLATIEVLFDLIQICQLTKNQLSYQLIPIDPDQLKLNPNLPLLDIRPILVTAIESWREWHDAGLSEYFPSRFPTIDLSKELPLFTDIDNLAEILKSIDGNRSLRSLAIHHRRHLLDFIKDIRPLVVVGLINLSLTPQSQLDQISEIEIDPPVAKKAASQQIDRTKLLIACIDDSILTYKNLERFLTEQGYRSYGVQDPLKVIPTLIKDKPNLIFLDLLMPITNGYEVCQQIRKTPSLKNIPVIILTAKNGLFDRMRAKAIGANEFLSKPISHADVLVILNKYLNLT
jgi:two-component system, chemotaxis family, response regulator PixG